MSIAAYKDKDRRRKKQSQYQRKYYLANRDRINELAKGYAKTHRTNLRKQVFDLLGGAVCSNCGCDVFEALEINHINGGGRKEIDSHSNYTNYLRAIRDGKVDRTDYNVLCKVCNTHHYIQEILGITGHKIIWAPS